MSQRAFAERVGVNQSHLGRILIGRRPIPIDRLGMWCEVLELDGPSSAALACAALRLQGADWIADLIAERAVHRRVADRTTRYGKGQPRPAPG